MVEGGGVGLSVRSLSQMRCHLLDGASMLDPGQGTKPIGSRFGEGSERYDLVHRGIQAIQLGEDLVGGFGSRRRAWGRGRARRCSG
jgi:hypothetical protein